MKWKNREKSQYVKEKLIKIIKENIKENEVKIKRICEII